MDVLGWLGEVGVATRDAGIAGAAWGGGTSLGSSCY